MHVRNAIGLMSGTSLDGVDVAYLSTDGERIAAFGPARTYPYSEADKEVFRVALADAQSVEDRNARPGVLKQAEVLVTDRHAEAVERFLQESNISPGDIDLVGFHGQTVFHDPARALTVQIGDGGALADRLGVSVVWDFRADDMAAGGQGAPLAPVFHRALAETAGLDRPVVFLNLGGVANVTYVGDGDELIAFDTGPGNSMLDDWTRERTGAPFDKDGALAASGTASANALQAFMNHPYFAAPAPKSLDRNAFSYKGLGGLTDADGAATLLQFSAQAVAESVQLVPQRPRAWYASGGGRHNLSLMRAIVAALPSASIQPIEALGFNGDAIEAQAFAFLAVRALDGRPISYPATTGVPEPLSGGRISHPHKRGL